MIGEGRTKPHFMLGYEKALKIQIHSIILYKAESATNLNVVVAWSQGDLSGPAGRGGAGQVDPTPTEYVVIC
jgi:hypothetical protein